MPVAFSDILYVEALGIQEESKSIGGMFSKEPTTEHGIKIQTRGKSYELFCADAGSAQTWAVDFNRAIQQVASRTVTPSAENPRAQSSASSRSESQLTESTAAPREEEPRPGPRYGSTAAYPRATAAPAVTAQAPFAVPAHIPAPPVVAPTLAPATAPAPASVPAPPTLQREQSVEEIIAEQLGDTPPVIAAPVDIPVEAQVAAPVAMPAPVVNTPAPTPAAEPPTAAEVPTMHVMEETVPAVKPQSAVAATSGWGFDTELHASPKQRAEAAQPFDGAQDVEALVDDLLNEPETNTAWGASVASPPAKQNNAYHDQNEGLSMKDRLANLEFSDFDSSEDGDMDVSEVQWQKSPPAKAVETTPAASIRCSPPPPAQHPPEKVDAAIPLMEREDGKKMKKISKMEREESWDTTPERGTVSASAVEQLTVVDDWDD